MEGVSRADGEGGRDDGGEFDGVNMSSESFAVDGLAVKILDVLAWLRACLHSVVLLRIGGIQPV